MDLLLPFMSNLPLKNIQYHLSATRIQHQEALA